MAAAVSLGSFLAKLEEQHRELLREMSTGTARLLAEENQALTDQLSLQSLEKLKQMKKISPQPDVPPFPSRLFTPPVHHPAFAAPPMLAAMPWQLVQMGTAAPLALPDMVPGTPKLERLRPDLQAVEETRPQSEFQDQESKPPVPMSPAIRQSSAKRQSSCPRSTRGSIRISQGTTLEPPWQPPAVNENGQVARKNQRRLRNLFGLAGHERFISAELVADTFKVKRPECDLCLSEIRDVMSEMCVLQVSKGYSDNDNDLLFSSLVDLAYSPDIMKEMPRDLRAETTSFLKAIHRTTVEEVINEVTRGANEKLAVVAKCEKRTSVLEAPLNGLVMFIVCINLISMGVSIDYEPNHWAWLVLETVCASIFLIECIFKLWQYGIRDYFKGEQRTWNILDACITCASVTEVTAAIILGFAADSEDDGSTPSGGVGAITPMLRVLRATRVVRLVKLLRFKVMRDLASMVVGIVIGLPALFWVFLLFVLVVFVMGTCFRVILGPYEGQDLIGLCGLPDDYPSIYKDDAECKLHYMYGEEFFGTVKSSMFTTFRFMIGDFSTNAGKSLAVAFSRGYGLLFESTYCIGMISVMFGLFNVITAIFVDSTISGLQHSDVKRKHSKQNESRFVRGKLHDLLNHIVLLRTNKQEGDPSAEFMLDGRRTYVVGEDAVENLRLQEGEFFEVFDNEIVKRIMEDLDVKMDNPSSMYDTFDPDGLGYITVDSLVEAIMKLRGEPQKNDLIASWQALRILHDKVDNLETLIKGDRAMATARSQQAWRSRDSREIDRSSAIEKDLVSQTEEGHVVGNRVQNVITLEEY